jgi:hypothetical protein
VAVDIQIRTIASDEFEAFMSATETAFGGFVEADDLERERSIAIDRSSRGVDMIDRRQPRRSPSR